MTDGFRIAEDGVERCAQLVAHQGEQAGDFAAGAVDAEGAGAGKAAHILSRASRDFGAGAAGDGGGAFGSAQHEQEGDSRRTETDAGTGEGADDVADGHGEGDREGEVAEGERRVQVPVEDDAAEVDMSTKEEDGPELIRDQHFGFGEIFPPNQ